MNPKKNSPKSQGAVRMPDVREQRDDKGLWVNVDVGQEATISAHTLSDDAKKPITIFWTGEVKAHSIEEFFEKTAPKANKIINALALTNTDKLTFENLPSLSVLRAKLPEGVTFLKLESIHDPNASSDFIAWSTIGRVDRIGVLLKVNMLRDIEGEVCNFIVNTHSRSVQADAARRGIDKIILRLGPGISSP